MNSIHKGNNYCNDAINILKYIMNIIILLCSNNSTDKLLSTTRPLHETNYKKTRIWTCSCKNTTTIYRNVAYWNGKS